MEIWTRPWLGSDRSPRSVLSTDASQSAESEVPCGHNSHCPCQVALASDTQRSGYTDTAAAPLIRRR